MEILPARSIKDAKTMIPQDLGGTSWVRYGSQGEILPVSWCRLKAPHSLTGL